jgi:hypothetical protein
MKKAIVFISLIMVLMLGACGIYVDSGSGDVVTETFDVSDFDRVSIDGFGNLVIEQSGKEGLVVEAEDNVIRKMDIEVRGNTLHISFKNVFLSASIIPTEPVYYYLDVKSLEDISVAGAANIDVDKLQAEDLSLEIAGAGKIDINELDAKDLRVIYSGAGSCDIAGQAERQSIVINGAGSYDGRNLKSQDVTVELNGAGSANVWAVDLLDVEINGVGTVNYYGSPSISQSINGLGALNDRGDKE